MDMTLWAATPTERLYAYDQSARIARQCGSPGCLFGELDNTLSVFFPNWTRNDPAEDTPEFRAEFNAVLDLLRSGARYGYVLKNRALMNVYCLNHAEAKCNRGWDYVFRADTQDNSYLIRCTPDDEDNIHAHVYPYRRERLEHHMKQAEQGIRFITTDFKERFRIPDGDMVRITRPGGTYTDQMCRYIDSYHMEVGRSLYNISEFAGQVEQNGGSVIPLRSSLPERCYSITSTADEIVIITKGEMYRRPAGVYAEGVTAREGATAANEAMGVTKAQEAAMLFGSMYGWDKPGADPAHYDEQGAPNKPKHTDRGDPR